MHDSDLFGHSTNESSDLNHVSRIYLPHIPRGLAATAGHDADDSNLIIRIPYDVSCIHIAADSEDDCVIIDSPTISGDKFNDGTGRLDTAGTFANSLNPVLVGPWEDMLNQSFGMLTGGALVAVGAPWLGMLKAPVVIRKYHRNAGVAGDNNKFGNSFFTDRASVMVYRNPYYPQHVPSKRAPVRVAGNLSIDTSFTGGTGQTLKLPTWGRTSVLIAARNNSGVNTVTVNVVRVYPNDATAPIRDSTPVFTAVLAPNGMIVRPTIALGPNMGWLEAYTDARTGAASVDVIMEARDGT
jgi:hypothetical protein